MLFQLLVITDEEDYWSRYDSTLDFVLPPGAVQGGYDGSGNPAYVCRGLPPIPGAGSYFPADGQCWYERAGVHASTQMDLLLVPTGTNAMSHGFLVSYTAIMKCWVTRGYKIQFVDQ